MNYSLFLICFFLFEWKKISLQKFWTWIDQKNIIKTKIKSYFYFDLEVKFTFFFVVFINLNQIMNP